MKTIKLPLIFFLLFCFFSCEKENTKLTPADFRLAMAVKYSGDHCISKTKYIYNEDRIDSVINYKDPFKDIFPYFNEARHFEYNDNLVVASELTFVGNQVTAAVSEELEFSNGRMIRNDDEEYTYTDGLLTKREFPERKKSEYEYENRNLVRITTYNYNRSLASYVAYEKFEFVYTSYEKISLSRYHYLSSGQWNLDAQIDQYYSGDLLIKKVFISPLQGAESSIYEYTYDDKGNLIEERLDGTYIDFVNIYDEYNNLIDVVSTNYSNGEVNRYLYYYEVGKSNMEQLKVPEEPYIIFYNFKKNYNE